METPASVLTRRGFIKSTAAALGAAALPYRTIFAETPAKYRRYNVTSDQGKKALASYAKGVEAMLKLPVDHPQNWFRHAFIHLMDCPHGNWWFYVWHRGYLGYFEEIIRNLSGDDAFAVPYWDWTALPQIPDSMFNGVLTPQSISFNPYTRNLAEFTQFVQPQLKAYWSTLNVAQRAQLKTRGYGEFDSLWNDVTGFDPQQKAGVSGNIAYANPCGARYLTSDNPKLDDKTAYNVSPFVVYAGLLPTDFYNDENNLSFNSSKTPSHNTAPGKMTSFSVLEGLPHNKVHNYIGGVGPLDPGPYGCMTNFLSPVDPVFFLHHANIDRLWDVWTRKQKALNLPYLPTGQDLNAFSSEPFLFFVNGKGGYVGQSRAGDYINMERFGYDYEPGFGEKVVGAPHAAPAANRARPPIEGTLHGNIASLVLPMDAVKEHLASPAAPSLVAEIILPRPTEGSPAREFDVVVGAPEDVTEVKANSPYYAGTVAFFGNIMKMTGMSQDVGFAVPLPRAPEAFHILGAVENVSVNIRLLPTHPYGQIAPALKSVSIRAM